MQNTCQIEKTEEIQGVKPEHVKAVRLLQERRGITDIAKECNVSRNSIYYYKKIYKDIIETGQVVETKRNNEEIDSYMLDDMLSHYTSISNTLRQTGYKKPNNVRALVLSLAVIIDKARLLSGKSTSNIATQVLHNLTPEQEKCLKSFINEYKESMLT